MGLKGLWPEPHLLLSSCLVRQSEKFVGSREHEVRARTLLRHLDKPNVELAVHLEQRRPVDVVQRHDPRAVVVVPTITVLIDAVDAQLVRGAQAVQGPVELSVADLLQAEDGLQLTAGADLDDLLLVDDSHDLLAKVGVTHDSS